LHDVWLSNVTHSWDSGAANVILDPSGSSISGDYPVDGQFSIFPIGCDRDIANPCDSTDPTHYRQHQSNEIESGQSVNLLIKLDYVNPDIPLSKTIKAQFNIGANQLSEFLLESGGAQ